MIIIDIAFKDPNTTIRKVLDSFSLAVIFVFSFVATKYGYDLWLDSTLKSPY